jgi:hypothetical protein
MRRVVVCAVAIVTALTGAITTASSSAYGAAPTIAPCAYNPTTEAITGANGSASAIGWLGNNQGVVTCLGGSFYVQGPTNKAFGFGIYAGQPLQWTDADGYLPAQTTTFTSNGLRVAITEFADKVTINADAFVVVYARVAVTNPTARTITGDPKPTPGFVQLARGPVRVSPKRTSTHDYAIAVDRFGAAYNWPTANALLHAGTFDAHYVHMRVFWNVQLSKIAAIGVPDAGLVNAYKSGFITTQIARGGGNRLKTGVNNYQMEFNHDVVGILTNLFTQGYDDNAHDLLLELRNIVALSFQYEDGIWTYAWPWAEYLLKTGDLAFVKANFATEGPKGALQPSIEDTAHRIATDRTGPNGIMGVTNDIDSDGLWTVDDFEALMGLAAYRYLAHAVGNPTEEFWAASEYNSLLAATNATLTATMQHFGLDYLPCSMVEPNSANRCSNPEDANWAAPFLSGRWAWDAQLFGANVSGPGLRAIDATYDYGFGRLSGLLPRNTFGGYPTNYFYSSAYNAGYGSWGLASNEHRSQGILSYEFMLANTQSGPNSWWESAQAPAPSPWVGSHPAGGQGSSPHAWGIANANKVLLDSLVAQAADGSLLVGRGIPNQWLTKGATISVANFPTTGGAHVSLKITVKSRTVTLAITGGRPSGDVIFELPAFVHNIASASRGTVDESTGSVRVSARTAFVRVRLQTAL